MLASDFDAYWRTTYPEAVPLGYLLRTTYPRRWLRLYSLPEGQRFPVDAADSPQSAPWSFTADGALQGLPFTRLSPVALHTLPLDPRTPDEYQLEDVYRPVCTRLLWTAATGEEFLRAIAEGQLSAFFVSADYGCLLAPYDGGLDIIFPREAARNYFRD